ncbi:MAG: capsule assembly Wzi family protein [Bacteroidales bacterium]|nr:capsule assembly Wzi family protein [Bacteroidales bacterium]
MKKLLPLIFLFLPLCLSGADAGERPSSWQLQWSSSARIGGSSGKYMPYFARTGEDGILPVRSSGLLTAGAKVSYSDMKGFFFDTEAALAGALALKSPLYGTPVYGLVDRLYVSGGWRMLRMDVGMIPRRGELGDLSITGGDMLMSGNARNLPGVNLSSDWIYFEKGHWVGIRGNLAHYHLLDNRVVKGAMLHNKAVAVKFALGRKVELIAGFDHYAHWGGEGQAVSFKDYVKVFFAKRGDSSDSWSDQNNVFGNHLGREWARLVWRARPFTMTFQYDKPFEDNSGMKFQNFPDGVWTLQFALNDRKAFVTDITYEFINTTWQSGDRHDRPATEEEKAKQDPSDPYYGRIVLGGCDNYFNNSPYGSGWTHHGRTMGLPLLVPFAPDADGVVRGIMSNRTRGHNLGIAGVASGKVPYRFKAVFTENFGTYSGPLPSVPWQLSLALEADIKGSLTGLPVSFSAGIYGDIGKLYQNSAGLTFRITYAGSRRF